MEKDQIKNYLKEVELFLDLDNSEMDLLSEKFVYKEFKSGEPVFVENTPRNHLYVIVKGKIELYKKTPFGKIKSLRIFEEKDFMGEGSLMDDYPHSTSTRMLDDGSVIRINRDAFNSLAAEYPQISAKIFSRIAKIVSRRMRMTTSQVVGAAQQYISAKTRSEHDLLGDRDVPDEVYYGVQTLRALENFAISGIPISHYPNIIQALAEVKMGAAQANHELELMDDDVTEAIVAACREIINGKYHSHFAVDMIQGGAGTSTNMNANEVIANRALELLGKQKGEYKYCHPNNHVNLSQSTNDAYPTALKIALIYSNQELIASLNELILSFREKGKEFAHVIKMGRTQLQDAVPMTLGQEFEAYACTLEEEILRLEENVKLFYEINMGGTAIGTGINADPRYSAVVTKKLRDITGLDLKLALNLVEATQDTGAFVMFSSTVKRLAVKVSKICNDLRLLSSGPRAGFNEINLPKMQPGSSIMPGKVNPVIPEVVNQIAFKVIGNDLTVTLAAEAGQLQLNVMEPVIAQSIVESMEMLKNGMFTLKYRCIDGITANEDVCREMVERSIGLVTALNPVLGYEVCSALAKEALESGKKVYDLVIEQNLMTKEELDRVLAPENMLQPQNLSKAKYKLS